MSSTNKTTNYNLSQYIGSDKPTYLGDYNSDMLKIDTQMKLNADNTSAANSLANTAKSTADSAVESASNAQTSANEAQTTANNAQTSASNANVKADNALAQIANFNLSDYIQKSGDDITITNGSRQGGSSINIAKNTEGSLAKIYGNIGILNVTGNVTVSCPSPLRPSAKFTIQNAGFVRHSYSGAEVIRGANISIDVDGTIEIPITRENNATYMYVNLLPILYWIKDFGDTDTQPE